jgi:hypothetical protein
MNICGGENHGHCNRINILHRDQVSQLYLPTKRTALSYRAPLMRREIELGPHLYTVKNIPWQCYGQSDLGSAEIANAGSSALEGTATE